MDVIGSEPECAPRTRVRSALRAARRRAAGRKGAVGGAAPGDPVHGGGSGGGFADGGAAAGEPGPASSPGGARRRILASAVGVVVAAAAVLALRAGTEPADVADVADTAPARITTAPPNGYGRTRLQPPPFDRLPGRTPIPNPSVDPADRRTIAGPLPTVGDGTPTAVNADTAARLVLGRYCRRPSAYDVATDPVDPTWRRVRARVTRAATAGRPRVFIDLRLRWDAAERTYGWTGGVAQLDTCS